MVSGPPRTGALAAALFALVLATSAGATAPDPDRFRAEIEAFIARLGPSSNGAVTWAGSEPYEVRRDGEGLSAVIENARLSLNTPQPSQLTLDRIEIREIGRREDGNLVELALTLPKSMTLNDPDGAETKIELKAASANTVIEAASGRGRETVIEIGGARIEQAKTGTWVSLGPLSMSSKLIAEPNGGWSGPVQLEVREIEYFLPQAPVGGTIDRIAFTGKSNGPRLKELDQLRDAIDRLQAGNDKSPQARATAFLGALPTIPEPFTAIRGELAVSGLTIRAVTGEKLIAVAKAGSTAEISGLDTEEAALRFGTYHAGLELAPSLLEKWKVPRRAMLDIGLVHLGTQPLKDLLTALITATDQQASGESESDANKQLALQQALGAAAKLNPTFRIYDVAVDTEDVGLGVTGEAKGSPLAPKGYTASAELSIRGFDAIPKLSGGIPFAEFLPVLREIGAEATAADGTPRLQFHLSSAPGNWIMINGNDVSAWFDGTEAAAGRPRVLKPADPPMHGTDVKSVQRALATAQMPVEEDGEYNSATAAAVARFQKQKGLNVSGVVDTATRQRLGGAADRLRQGGRN